MKFTTVINAVTGDETGLASQLISSLSLSTQTIKGCPHHGGLHSLNIRTGVTRELKEQRFRATHVSRNSSPFLYTLTLLNLYCKVPFSVIKTIYPRVWTKPLPNDAKSPLPVNVRRSKTLLLKPPSMGSLTSNKNHNSERAVRRSLRFCRAYLRRLKCLTFCRCEYKGSTFSSVI